jgi:hypothetical protein
MTLGQANFSFGAMTLARSREYAQNVCPRGKSEEAVAVLSDDQLGNVAGADVLKFGPALTRLHVRT